METLERKIANIFWRGGWGRRSPPPLGSKDPSDLGDNQGAVPDDPEVHRAPGQEPVHNGPQPPAGNAVEGFGKSMMAT